MWPFAKRRCVQCRYLERIAITLERIADRKVQDKRLAEALHNATQPLKKAVQQNKGH
jgi:hypothetical protein